MRKRKQRDEQEMESLRLKILKKEAETSYHALLVETIKDPKVSLLVLSTILRLCAYIRSF